MDNELIKHFPVDTTETVEKSSDGAKVYMYARENIDVRHLYANGARELEKRAEEFFNEMQTDVDMVLVPLQGAGKSFVSSECSSS